MRMTPEQFDAALEQLGWKQSDFCRMTDVDKKTPSRWSTGAITIPGWVPHYLSMAQKVKELSDFIDPAKRHKVED
jgi:hypothetical protein